MSSASPAGVSVSVGMLGLVLVEERQRAAAGPAAEDDPLVAEALLQIGDARAEVEETLLQNEGGVVAAIAGVAIDDVPAGAGQRRDQGEECAAADRMGEEKNRLRVAGLRPDAHALDEHLAGGAAIDVLERALVRMHEAVRLSHYRHRTSPGLGPVAPF